MKVKDFLVPLLFVATAIIGLSVLVYLLPSTPQVGTAIGVQNVLAGTPTTWEYVEEDSPEAVIVDPYSWWTIPDKPEYFIKITSSEYFDISEMFVNGRLKVIIDDEVYWIVLRKDTDIYMPGIDMYPNGGWDMYERLDWEIEEAW